MSKKKFNVLMEVNDLSKILSPEEFANLCDQMEYNVKDGYSLVQSLCRSLILYVMVAKGVPVMASINEVRKDGE